MTVSDIDAVVSEVRIAASQRTVFAYFVDPDKMARWIGTRVEIDPRPGGAYAIDMNPHTRARGEYVAIEPYSRIVFTWGWLDDPDLPPSSSTIEVTLAPDGDGTYVRLVHRGLLTAAMRAQHRQGWLLYLPRLAEAATGGNPGPDPNALPESAGGGGLLMTTSAATTKGVELVRQIVRGARHVLESTMADVTQQQADFIPPGVANPLGATYAHVVCSEDLIVQGMFRHQAPLGASTWTGRTGLSEPMPMPGGEWVNYAPWTRRVKIDLEQLRAYAQAVAEQTDTWIASLSDADLDQPMDLSDVGLGQHTLGSAIGLLVANHLGTETGEIAVLKGIQGARGYPM